MKYRKKTIIDILKHNGVPPKFIDADLVDFPKFKYSAGDSLYIHGKTGLGKTRLLCAIARELSSTKGINPDWRLISVPKLLFKIRQCYNDNSRSEEQLVELYSTIDVLLLDDIGAEKASEWSLQTLYLILNDRYENELTTIITSNYELSTIAEYVGERITSRISEMCRLVKLAGKDRRVLRALHR